MNPVGTFRAPHYQHINAARMAHLASLGIDLKGKTILELGAGIGDITSYLTTMGCGRVTRIESRPENCAVMLREHPEQPVICDDLMNPKELDEVFDVCLAYGILYHLSDPTKAIEFMARHSKIALVGTCVSLGVGASLNPVNEASYDPSQSSHGEGSRPTRAWMFSALLKRYQHVYCPITQPNHPQFQLNWSGPPQAALTRAIFVCSQDPIMNPILVDRLPETQTRLDVAD